MSCLDPVSFFLIPENIELFHGKLMFSRQALNHASIFFLHISTQATYNFFGNGNQARVSEFSLFHNGSATSHVLTSMACETVR